MARQEIGKVQEMLVVSTQEQQETTGEGENLEIEGLSAQQQTRVGSNLLL